MSEVKITSSGIKQAIDDLVNENEMLQDKVYKLEDIIKEVRELRNYLSNKYYEMGEEVDIGVIVEHLDRILDKENKNE